MIYRTKKKLVMRFSIHDLAPAVAAVKVSVFDRLCNFFVCNFVNLFVTMSHYGNTDSALVL